VIWRKTAALAGAAVVVAAQFAPLDDRFWTHMVQHLLIGDIGPLLIAVAWQRRVHPALALPLWAAALVGWHVPALYDAALRHGAVHVVQHLTFVVSGVAVWSVVLGRGLATAWKLAYVGAIWLVSLTLSQVFIWSGHSYYSGYTVADQRAGGGVMLVEGSFVMLGVVVWLLLRLFEETELRQRALERG
jgi:putative membrane protein